MPNNKPSNTLLPLEDSSSEVVSENKIYNIRNQQVMLDSDVAFYFQVETRTLNQQMKRNKTRFPSEFCFQLNSKEFKISTSQNVISSYGGRRYLPYVYTEPGIVALAGVLKSRVATEASVKIVRQFVEMRHFLLSNGHLLESLATIQNRQLKFEDKTNQKFDLVFKKIEQVDIPKENIFVKGQFFDAYDLIIKLVLKAQMSIILIDPYCDEKTLSFFISKKKEIRLTIVKSSNAKLSPTDIERYSSQYGDVSVINNNCIHDRFLIIDNEICYSLGSSLNHLGNKTIVMTEIENKDIIDSIIKACVVNVNKQ